MRLLQTRLILAAVIALLWTGSAGAAAPPGFTQLGIQMDGGALGYFTLEYPKFKTAEGQPVKPEITNRGDTVELTYLASGAPRITLRLDGDKVHLKMDTATPGYLQWEMYLPITLAGQGSYLFLSDSGGYLQEGDLPANLQKPHLAQLNAAGFAFTDARTDCSLAITVAPGGFWQLQDNREWEWKIFLLSFLTDVYGNHTGQTQELTFTSMLPEKPKLRVDRFGQAFSLDFPGKISSEDELKQDIASDAAYFAALTPPPRAPWGGMPGSRERFNLKATGFFRTDRVEGRDILVTPEGDLFFQLAVCSLSPGDDYTHIRGREAIYEWLPQPEGPFATAYRRWTHNNDFSFYLANRIRKTGQPFDLKTWKEEQFYRLRQWGFNSEGAFCDSAGNNPAEKFGRTVGLQRPHGIIGEICDPFDEEVRRELDRMYSEIAQWVDDPSIIGYYIANEQPYSNVPRQVSGFGGNIAAKRELVRLLEAKYGNIAAFNAAWNMNAIGFTALADLPLPVQTEAAWQDMQEYAAHFYDAYFKLVSETFRKYDPNHLLIGARFLVAENNVADAVAACGRYCDVFSVNYYTRAIDPAFLDRIHALAGKPLLLSEWSYGTAEQGLAGGVVDVPDQYHRGLAYRAYVETATTLPYVVGHQWFSYLDQALTGRWFEHYNGECMNIGLLNVADRPYREFLAEVMKTNYRIYELLTGEAEPLRPEAVLGTSAGARPVKSVQIPRALPGHQVDGVRAPWPGRPSERIDASCLVSGADDGGVAADFWLCFDDEYLYFFIDVTDPTPARNNRSGADLWQGDCVELFLGAEDPESDGPLRFGDRQILISANRASGDSPAHRATEEFHYVNQPENPAFNASRAVVLPSPSGYVMEAAIPWQALRIEPRTGLTLRFDLGLDDGDNGPKRLRQFMWSGKSENSSERTGWGRATLVD